MGTTDEATSFLTSTAAAPEEQCTPCEAEAAREAARERRGQARAARLANRARALRAASPSPSATAPKVARTKEELRFEHDLTDAMRKPIEADNGRWCGVLGLE